MILSMPTFSIWKVLGSSRRAFLKLAEAELAAASTSASTTIVQPGITPSIHPTLPPKEAVVDTFAELLKSIGTDPEETRREQERSHEAEPHHGNGNALR